MPFLQAVFKFFEMGFSLQFLSLSVLHDKAFHFKFQEFPIDIGITYLVWLFPVQNKLKNFLYEVHIDKQVDIKSPKTLTPWAFLLVEGDGDHGMV